MTRFVFVLTAVVICVPTPYTKAKQPDLTCIYQAASMVVEHLHPGMLVVLESTTYPGTTQEVLQPLLEARGLICGRDFELAYSPERVDPGNPRFTLQNTPKIVSGVTKRATEMAVALYGRLAETVVPVSTPRVAEISIVDHAVSPRGLERYIARKRKRDAAEHSSE